MGGNICVFQRKFVPFTPPQKYDDEKKEVDLRKVPRRVTQKEEIVNEITCDGMTKRHGEGTNQLGKTNEEREKSILSLPSTSTNSDSDESEEATTDTSSLTSSSMIRSNIKANIICERCLLQNSYSHNICDFTRGYRRGRSSPPLGEAKKIAFNKSASFGGTVPHSHENFRDLSEFIWTEKEDTHLGEYLKGGKYPKGGRNYLLEKPHSQRRELCSAWGRGDPRDGDGSNSTRKEHKATTKGKVPIPLKRTTDESTLTDPSRSEDNSSSAKPRKWEKRGKSLDIFFPSSSDNSDYKRGRVPLTKCNSSYFNNRGVIIYS